MLLGGDYAEEEIERKVETETENPGLSPVCPWMSRDMSSENLDLLRFVTENTVFEVNSVWIRDKLTRAKRALGEGYTPDISGQPQC